MRHALVLAVLILVGGTPVLAQTRPQPDHPRSQFPASMPPPVHASSILSTAGTISGAIWWDSRTVKTGMAPIGSVCNATGISAVIHEVRPGQRFASSMKVGSTPQWSSLMQSGGKPANILSSGTIIACLFTITGVPVQTEVTIEAHPSPDIFLPRGGGNLPNAIGPQVPVKIPGGSCGAPPQAITTLAQLRAPVAYCGNGAYHVIYELKPVNL